MPRTSRSKRPAEGAPYQPVVVGTGRETSLKRRVAVCESRYSVLITTNGQSTEVDYLKALGREDWVSSEIGKYQVKFFRKAPKDLLRVSRAELARLGYDHLYAVTDVDEYLVGDLRRAVEMFRKDGSCLVVCNPCFEAWLLLHFEDCRGYLSNGAEAIDRLRKFVPGYMKNSLDFAPFRPGVGEAAGRARRVADIVGTNPSSGMWVLVEGLKDPARYDQLVQDGRGLFD